MLTSPPGEARGEQPRRSYLEGVKTEGFSIGCGRGAKFDDVDWSLPEIHVAVAAGWSQSQIAVVRLLARSVMGANEDHLGKMEADAVRLKSDLETVQASQSELHKTCSQALDQHLELEAHVARVRHDVEQGFQSLECDIKTGRHAGESALASLRRDLEAQGELSEELKTMQRQVQQLELSSASHHELSCDLQGVQATLQVLRRSVEQGQHRTDAELLELTKQVEQVQRSGNAKLQSLIAGVMEELQVAQTATTSLRRTWEQSHQRTDAELGELHREVEASRGMVSKVEMIKEDIAESAAAMARSVDQALAPLQSEIEEMKGSLDLVRGQLRRLDSATLEVRAECKGLRSDLERVCAFGAESSAEVKGLQDLSCLAARHGHMEQDRMELPMDGLRAALGLERDGHGADFEEAPFQGVRPGPERFLGRGRPRLGFSPSPRHRDWKMPPCDSDGLHPGGSSGSSAAAPSQDGLHDGVCVGSSNTTDVHIELPRVTELLHHRRAEPRLHDSRLRACTAQAVEDASPRTAEEAFGAPARAQSPGAELPWAIERGLDEARDTGGP